MDESRKTYDRKKQLNQWYLKNQSIDFNQTWNLSTSGYIFYSCKVSLKSDNWQLRYSFISVSYKCFPFPFQGLMDKKTLFSFVVQVAEYKIPPPDMNKCMSSFFRFARELTSIRLGLSDPEQQVSFDLEVFLKKYTSLNTAPTSTTLFTECSMGPSNIPKGMIHLLLP